jgi:hypothetical protein
MTVVNTVIGLIGSVAGVVAAIPVVMSWLRRTQRRK